MSTELEKAYAAGLFDGDGTVSFRFDNPAVGARIQVNITQKDVFVLEWMLERFGGKITVEREHYRRWTPQPKEQFLRDIAPYLVQKKERVERLLTDYYDLNKSSGRTGSTNLTEDAYTIRKELESWFRLQTLATTGKPSRR